MNTPIPKVKAADANAPGIKESWSTGGQILFLGDYAWGLDENLKTICLGLEIDVRRAIANPKLKSSFPTINSIIAQERILQKELENEESHPNLRRPGSVRGKPARAFKRRAANPKQTAPRKRAALHQVKRKEPGISSGRHPGLVKTTSHRGVATPDRGVATPDRGTRFKTGRIIPPGKKSRSKNEERQGILAI